MKPASNILLIANRNSKVRSFKIDLRRTALLALITIFALCGGILSSGYSLGISSEARKQLAEFAALQTMHHQQQAEITFARETARANLDALTLTLRLGRMQARLLRLDALGVQLVTQANLDATEFDFAPPQPWVDHRTRPSCRARRSRISSACWRNWT